MAARKACAWAGRGNGSPLRRPGRFLSRDPIEAGAQPAGDIHQMADGGRAMADFHIGNGPPARLDAVEPVLEMVIAHREPLGVRRQRRVGQFRRITVKLVIVDPYRAAVAVELRGAGRTVVELDHYAARVAIADAISLAADAVAAGDFLRLPIGRRPKRLVSFGPNVHRARGVGAERPLDLVQPMRPPAGRLAARVGRERDPARFGPRREDVDVIGPRLGLAAPDVPVEPFEDGLSGQATVPRAGIIGGDHRMHFADHARADQLTAGPVFVHRPALAAGLKGAAVLAGGGHHGPSLADSQGERLLGIDVLAGLAGVDARQGVPVVGRGDNHGVHLPRFQHLAVFVIAPAFQLGRDFIGPGSVDIADGHDPAFLGQAHQLLAAASHADIADADAIVGAGPARGGQYARRNQQRRRATGRRARLRNVRREICRWFMVCRSRWFASSAFVC